MRFAYSLLSIAVLTALSTSSFAEESNYQESILKEATVKFNTIIIEAQQENEVGKTIYLKEDLERTPNSSKNITDFLKVNSNVQFSQSQLAAGSQGEITPAEISINGARTFHNNFIVNSVPNNLLIAPANANINAIQDIGTDAQAMAVNTVLRFEAAALNSNVSAAYGHVTGGVVNPKSCAPQTEEDESHAAITYRYPERN